MHSVLVNTYGCQFFLILQIQQFHVVQPNKGEAVVVKQGFSVLAEY